MVSRTQLPSLFLKSGLPVLLMLILMSGSFGQPAPAEPAAAPEALRLPPTLAPAAFAAPEEPVRRVSMPDNLMDPQQEAALAARLDRFYATKGLNLYVVYGEADSEIAAEALKLELQRGNTALLTLLSNGDPSLILGIPLREKVDADRVRKAVQNLWAQQTTAGFRLEQQVLSVADLILANVEAPLPLPQDAPPAAPPGAAAARPPGEIPPPAAVPQPLQADASPPEATAETEEDGLPPVVRQTLRIAIISIIFLLIAAGGGFALLNMYRPVQASPETQKRAAQRAQHEQRRTRAERQRLRQAEQDKRREATERRKRRVEKTMRDTQKLLEAATKKLTSAMPAPPSGSGSGSGGGGIGNSRRVQSISPAEKLAQRNRGETFEDWLWRALKDFNRLHYGKMTDNLTPQKEALLRNHGFFDALEELAAYFKWHRDEAAQEGKVKDQREYEERFGLVKNYAATLQRTAPNLRKHVMGGVESFLRECQEGGYLPKPGDGRGRRTSGS